MYLFKCLFSFFSPYIFVHFEYMLIMFLFIPLAMCVTVRSDSDIVVAVSPKIRCVSNHIFGERGGTDRRAE